MDSVVYEEWLDDGFCAHAPVGSFRANAFGLHDVCGNLWEFCQDAYGPYPDAPPDGSARESGMSPDRILRGGAWNGIAYFCRSAVRYREGPTCRNNHEGIRPAASLK
jgi:formylglycine-generating enzyme required for sulfatase activity